MIIFEKHDGNTAYDGDRSDLKPKHIQTIGELNEYESNNIMLAQEWLLKVQPQLTPMYILQMDFLKTLHHKMFNKTWKWAGKFRIHDTNIGIPWACISEHLYVLLENIQYWIQEKTYTIEEIGMRFHHGMVHIHLFPNGNGRHSRLATDVLLLTLHHPRFNWGREEDFAVESAFRANYIHALREVDVHNYEPLRRFLCQSTDDRSNSKSDKN